MLKLFKEATYSKKIAPIFLSVFFMRFSFGLTVLTLQSPHFGLTTIERGIIGAAYPAAEICTAFLFGVLADRHKRKLIIAYALLGSSLANLAFVVSRNVLFLAIAHGVQGLCSAAVLSSSLALIANQAYAKTRGREMGFYDFTILAGYFGGFVFSSIISSIVPTSLSLPFYGGAALAFSGSISALVFIKESEWPKGRSVHIFDNVKDTLKNRRSWGILPAWVALTMLIGALLSFTREFGFFLNPRGGGAIFSSSSSNSYFALELALITAGLAFTQPFFGRLSDKLGRRKLVVVGQFSVLGVFLGMVVFKVGGLPELLGLAIAVPFAIGMLAFTPAALALLADTSKDTNIGSTMGLYTLSVGVGTTVGQLLVGSLLSKFGVNLGFVYFFCIGAVILTGAIFINSAAEIISIIEGRRKLKLLGSRILKNIRE